MPATLQEIADRIIAWATEETGVRAVILEGSMARAHDATTPWSDLDVNLYTTDSDMLLNGEAWIHAISEVWVILPLPNPGSFPTRLTWFAGGKKVDFAILPVGELRRRVDERDLPVSYQHGYKIWVDKDGLAAQLPPPLADPPFAPKPTFAEFDQVVRGFWHESLHVAQYIRGRQLWVVKLRDAGIKHRYLLTMMEWHALMRHDWAIRLKHIGKNFAEWTDPTTWQAVHTIWANFDPGDSWPALRAQLRLFSRLAREVADYLDFAYDVDRDTTIMAYVDELQQSDDLRYD